MTVVNAKASDAEQKAAWDFLSWLNGPKSGPNGGSAMGDILVSMGILPSRTSDSAAFADKLSDPFLKAYIDEVPDAKPFPVVLGGQEVSESLQQTLEAVQFGKVSGADAATNAQPDAAASLSKRLAARFTGNQAHFYIYHFFALKYEEYKTNTH